MQNTKNVRNRKIVLICGFCFLFTSISLICIVGYQLFRYKCIWWSCAPNRDFSVFDLNLPSDYFPSGAEVPILQNDRGIATAIEEARGASNWDGGGAVYIVKKFGTVNQAFSWFDLRSKKDLFTSRLESTSLYNDILNYSSPIADDYKVGCGYVSDQVSCIMSARYQEFYIYFNGYLNDNGMTPIDFLEIIRFIDSRMKDLMY